MATSVRLDDEFVRHAKVHADAEHHSLPKQIEYWAKIGKIVADNPDLPYEFVRESLLATNEIAEGLKRRYVRRTKRD